MKTDTFLRILAERYKGTRRLIEAIPPDKLDFRPIPELMSTRELALHLVANYSFLLSGMEMNRWNPEAFDIHGESQSLEELLSRLDEVYEKTREKAASFPDQAFSIGVNPFGFEQKVSSLVMQVAEHEIHHRGQLTVYLRLMGAVPPALH